MLELVGLEGKGDRMPDELSGGEQQRVAIARAFANRPMILIADEPTGNLDPSTSVGIMKLLDRINRTGTTVVMATHDAAIVDSMRRRVVELSAGRVVRDQSARRLRLRRLTASDLQTRSPCASARSPARPSSACAATSSCPSRPSLTVAVSLAFVRHRACSSARRRARSRTSSTRRSRSRSSSRTAVTPPQRDRGHRRPRRPADRGERHLRVQGRGVPALAEAVRRPARPAGQHHRGRAAGVVPRQAARPHAVRRGGQRGARPARRSTRSSTTASSCSRCSRR